MSPAFVAPTLLLPAGTAAELDNTSDAAGRIDLYAPHTVASADIDRKNVHALAGEAIAMLAVEVVEVAAAVAAHSEVDCSMTC
jgi:hypothetical protein